MASLHNGQLPRSGLVEYWPGVNRGKPYWRHVTLCTAGKIVGAEALLNRKPEVADLDCRYKSEWLCLGHAYLWDRNALPSKLIWSSQEY